MLKISAEEKAALKGRGFIITNDGEHFIARVVSPSGVFTSEQITAVAAAAGKYGSGKLALTVRLCAEIQGIRYEDIEKLNEAVIAAGLTVGGTGPRIRPIVPCKGTVCVHGLMDTQAFSKRLYDEFYVGWHNVKLPGKFKIGIGGCPNNCVKPSLNDFGIVGQRVPEYDREKCNACGKCAVVEKCPIRAASRDADGKMTVDKTKCTNCGKCIELCPFKSCTEIKRGFRVYLGGFWGKNQKAGTPIDGIYSEEEVIKLLEKVLLLYRENGLPGERFAKTLDRIGFDVFYAQLMSDEVLARKSAILEG